MRTKLVYQYWQFPVHNQRLLVPRTREVINITNKQAGEFEYSVDVCGDCNAEDSVDIEYDGMDEPMYGRCCVCGTINPDVSQKIWHTTGKQVDVVRDFH